MSFKEQNKTNLRIGFYDLLRDIGRGTFRRNLFDLSKIRGRKSYPVYKLLRYGNKILLKYKRMLVEDMPDYFNMKKTNRVVGFLPDFAGATRSSIVNSKNYITEFISDRFNEIESVVSSSCFEDLMSSIENPRAVYSAGYDTIGSHLREYLKDNVTETYLDRDEILKILEYSKFKWFAAPICSYYNGAEIFTNLRTNFESFSGHYTSRLFGPKKGTSDSISRKVAHKLWEKIAIKPLKNLYLWTILGREKDIKFDFKDFNEKEVGTRLILSCESPITYFLMWISQKMTHILSYSKWDKSYDISGEFNADKYAKLIDYGQKYDYCLEADWTYYDSNIDTSFLEIAGAILCTGMPIDKLHVNIGITFIMSVVTKYIIMPPGIVVELNRAQPSGHPAGTLINCNVNLIYWCLIGYKIYGKDYSDNMRVEVYGDDTRAFFKDHPNLIKIDDYIKECGLKSEPVLPNIRSTLEDSTSEFSIDFLKRRFNTEGIKWNHKKMFDKFLYQSKNRKFEDQVLVVLSFLQSVPTDSDLNKFVGLFNEWIIEKYPDKITREIRKELESALSLGSTRLSRSDRFNFQYGNKIELKGFNDQIDLLSFSVIRKRTEFNDIIADHVDTREGCLILYSLGLDHAQLARVDPEMFNSKKYYKKLTKSKFRTEMLRYSYVLNGEVKTLMNRIYTWYKLDKNYTR